MQALFSLERIIEPFWQLPSEVLRINEKNDNRKSIDDFGIIKGNFRIKGMIRYIHIGIDGNKQRIGKKISWTK